MGWLETFRIAWRGVNATAIRTRLPTDNAAVELIRYHVADFHALCRGDGKTGPARYAAVVIHPTKPTVVIDVGAAEELEGRGGGEALRAAM